MAHLSSIVVVVVLAVVAFPAVTLQQQSMEYTNTRCTQRGSKDFRPVPNSCTKFQMCSMGTLINFVCPAGSVFHDVSGTCVPEGSQYDTCTSTSSGRFPVACPRGATYKKAHPKKCALYFHCGKTTTETGFDANEFECEYPMLFDEETKRCEHYTSVICGQREEPFDPCDYKMNQCRGPHCRPCSITHPSCRGMNDGMNEWVGRHNSPYYVVCSKQRIVYSGMCSQNNGAMNFDKNLKACVSLSNRKFWWQ